MPRTPPEVPQATLTISTSVTLTSPDAGHHFTVEEMTAFMDALRDQGFGDSDEVIVGCSLVLNTGPTPYSGAKYSKPLTLSATKKF